MMGKKYTSGILAGFLLLLGSLLFGENVTGTLVYIDGTVDVYRDGKRLDWSLVDTGFTVQEYDLLTTGSDSTVEIELVMPSGTGAHITVRPNTSFYFEEKEIAGKKKTSFRMLTGAMAYKVQKLAESDTLSVETSSIVMGVRGTEFQAVYSPGGGVLVLCNEGRVAVDDLKGAEKYSEPGSIVEKVPEKELTAFAVAPSDLSLYRSYWLSSRNRIFRKGAGTFIKGFIKQFLLFRPEFDKAYASLLDMKPVLQKYGTRSSSYSLGSLLKARGEVSPAVVRMRSVLPMYEMVFYRLKVLEKYHEQGLGHGTVEKGLTTEAFFKTFSGEKVILERRLAEVRYLFKLYTSIHEASGGGPSILDEPFGGISPSPVPKSSFSSL